MVVDLTVSPPVCLLAYLATLRSALERLTTNLNETREARQEAQSINTTVASRQYDNIAQDLTVVTTDTNTVLSMGEVFLDQAERNSREAMVIDEGLNRVEPGLGDVTETAQGALEEAAAAQNNSQRVEELIEEIQVPYSGKLLREKTFANFTVLWLYVKVFSAKFGAWRPSAWQKRAICESFLRENHIFTNSRKPSKVSCYTVFEGGNYV